MRSHPYPATTRRLRGWLSVGRDSDPGYSVVEVVVMFPAMVLLLMLAMQYVLVWHGRHVAQAAAEHGLRAGRSYQASDGAGEESARRYLVAVAPRLLGDPQVEASRDAATVRVRVRAQVVRVLPFGTYGIEESVSGPVERFVDPRTAP